MTKRTFTATKVHIFEFDPEDFDWDDEAIDEHIEECLYDWGDHPDEFVIKETTND